MTGKDVPNSAEIPQLNRLDINISIADQSFGLGQDPDNQLYLLDQDSQINTSVEIVQENQRGETFDSSTSGKSALNTNSKFLMVPLSIFIPGSEGEVGILFAEKSWLVSRASGNWGELETKNPRWENKNHLPHRSIQLPDESWEQVRIQAKINPQNGEILPLGSE